MSPKLRNLSVGVVVIAAMVILAWMIFRFGAEPAKLFRPPQITVTFVADRADGLGDGSTITYRGIEVGRVLTVRRDPDTDTIVVPAEIDANQKLPANLTADIVIASPLGGVAGLQLKQVGDKPEGLLAAGATIQARYLGSTFLPPEFSDLARNLNDSVRQFNDAKIIESLRKTIDITAQRIDDTGKIIEGISKLVNDPKVQEDLRASLASIRATSDNAKAITQRLEALSTRFDGITDQAEKTIASAQGTFDTTTRRIDQIGVALGEQLTKVSKVLDNVTEISAKINTGNGTAGQFVNDPRLYQALVDTSRELNGTVADFRRLVNQWEQEGVTLKLGK